uniref:Uncharacterized protein n=1 Tax=Timema douglasi TaxID=61478 RepID=A0A7R8VBR2_TIMDO|nr:unnamed protein product [Timema douglasi]
MNSHTLPRMGRPLLPEADSRQRPAIRISEQRSRPVSLYDNLRGGGGSLGMMTASSTGQLSTEYSPSQAVYLSTTVPQNIAGGNIAGRHAPTRNSLRHSRMIVLSRTGQVSRKYHPPIMRHHKLATGLASLQLLVGIAITTLAVWLLLWAPHLRARDIPYWSGVPSVGEDHVFFLGASVVLVSSMAPFWGLRVFGCWRVTRGSVGVLGVLVSSMGFFWWLRGFGECHRVLLGALGRWVLLGLRSVGECHRVCWGLWRVGENQGFCWGLLGLVRVMGFCWGLWSVGEWHVVLLGGFGVLVSWGSVGSFKGLLGAGEWYLVLMGASGSCMRSCWGPWGIGEYHGDLLGASGSWLAAHSSSGGFGIVVSSMRSCWGPWGIGEYHGDLLGASGSWLAAHSSSGGFGIVLLTSGVLGLLLLCCCRKEYPGMPLGFFVFSIKALSVLLSVLAGCACFCASVFSLLHLIFLSQMSCQPPHALYSTCVCRTVQALVNETVPRVYHYTDLNCGEVGILVVLLIGSCAANGIGGILATWYVFLHWSSRYTYLYSEVKTNDNKPIVITNKMATLQRLLLYSPTDEGHPVGMP